MYGPDSAYFFYIQTAAFKLRAITGSTRENVFCDFILRPAQAGQLPWVCGFGKPDDSAVSRHRQKHHGWDNLSQDAKRIARFREGDRVVINWDMEKNTPVFPTVPQSPQTSEPQELNSGSSSQLSAWSPLFEQSPASSLATLSTPMNDTAADLPSESCTPRPAETALVYSIGDHPVAGPSSPLRHVFPVDIPGAGSCRAGSPPFAALSCHMICDELPSSNYRSPLVQSRVEPQAPVPRIRAARWDSEDEDWEGE